MSRLSIEISEQQHQQIKAMAAISGLSIKDYIIEKTLPSTDEEPYSQEELEAFKKLEEFLRPSLEAVERGEYFEVTMEEIIAEARAERGL
ncbi:MAG: antitoxin [Pseudomonadota bacterium]